VTNISKRALSKQQTDQLFTQLGQMIAQSTSASSQFLLDELLGYEEQVMLAKRLAAIILLSRGVSIYKTAEVLHMSTATASKLNERITDGECDQIIKTLNQESYSIMTVLESIDNALHLGGLLPRYGRSNHRKN